MRYAAYAVAAIVTASCCVVPSAQATSYRPPVRPPLPPSIPAFGVDDGSVCGEDANGCYDATTNRVLLVHPTRWTRQHELGHIADAQAMSDEERSSFLKLMPLVGHIEPDAGWEGYDEDDAYFYGAAEVFADAYASCRLRRLPRPRPDRHGVIVGSWEGSYGYDPDTNARQRRICARISRWIKSPRPT